MSQGIKALLAKSENPSSIPGTQTLKGDNLTVTSCPLTSTYVLCHEPLHINTTHTYMHECTHKCILKKLEREGIKASGNYLLRSNFFF